jgi:GNAT superfamily N-acetyltransferase
LLDARPLDPASRSLLAALEDDPFYLSITVELAGDVDRRRSALTQYLSYSVEEGRTLGRTVHLADQTLGAAVWLLPRSAETAARAAARKRSFLYSTLGPRGAGNYYRMVEYMIGKSKALVSDGAWYLSIIGVDPASQGRGLGQQLLTPTLAEADASGALCYLETFSPRNLRFYGRLGFETLARFEEPVAGAEYVIMARHPRSR